MSQPRLLIVEDEKIIALEIRNRLRQLGYTVSAWISKGEAAIQKVSEMFPDLVLMDIQLKGEMNGFEVAEQIATRFDVPIVYLIDSIDHNTLISSRVSSAFGCVYKPFELNALRISIEMALYRHEKEREFKEKKKWLDTLLNSIPDAMIVTDKKGIVLFANSRVESSTGWKPKYIIGKFIRNLFNIVNAKTGKAIMNPIQKIIRNGTAYEFTGHVLSDARSQNERPVQGECKSVHDEQGIIIGVAFIFHDVSKYKLSETDTKDLIKSGKIKRNQTAYCERSNALLIQERNLLDTLMDHVPDPIFFKDKELRFIRINRAEVKHLSLIDPQEAVGKTDFDFLPQEYAQSAYETEREIIRSGNSITNQEVSLHDDDGRKRYFLSTKVPILDESNQVVGLVGIDRDITERRQIENALKQTMQKMQQMITKLKQSNAELQQFAYISSHDLQEPLRMVAIYVQLLADRYQGKLDANADEFIHYAVQGVKRMQSLIKDLLLYSRIGSTSKPLKPTEISKVFHSVLDNLKVAIEERRARITTDLLPNVTADLGQMKQLFENLIGNAIKFNKEKIPLVHIGAERINSEWVFSVKDNGIGIEPQYIDHIFKPFYRVHSLVEYPGT
ncbi:PAS domain-containing protein, partial [bacterium]|nr:PAS domain-containing protein [bacterium]